MLIKKQNGQMKISDYQTNEKHTTIKKDGKPKPEKCQHSNESAPQTRHDYIELALKKKTLSHETKPKRERTLP